MKDKKTVQSYRDLLIWQKGIELVTHVYRVTEKLPRSETFALTSQVRKAAISVPSNIAEGHARQHSREFRQFLYIALGSLAELDTQLTIALKLAYVSESDLDSVHANIVELRRMISGLVSKLPPDP